MCFDVQIENNYQIQVPIFKQFHKNIIGKGGATIKKVCKFYVITFINNLVY